MNLLKTQGSEYQRIAYSVPLGYQGLRGGVHYSNLNYELIGDFAALGAKGVAQTTGLDFSYGISLTWLGPEGVDFKATAAQRINSNPLQSALGLDTDGSHKTTRLWFTASKAF